MFSERIYKKAAEEPIYQNLISPRQPVIAERHNKTWGRGAQTLLDKTLPNRNMKEADAGSSSGLGLHESGSRCSAYDESKPCTEEHCFCKRPSVEKNFRQISFNSVNSNSAHSESDSSDSYDDTGVLPTASYSDPGHCTGIPPSHHKRMMIPKNQSELFNMVPPPSSPVTCPTPKTSSPNPNLIARPRAFSPNHMTRPSATVSIQLTDSVPPLPLKLDSSAGYVPHKPSPRITIEVEKNGYLKMKKTPSVQSGKNKPPFDISWIGNDSEISADDPEYFSFSELYADEPLYQIYHKTAVVRDVLEQTVEDEEDADDIIYEDYQMILSTVLHRSSKKHGFLEAGREDAVQAMVESLLPASPGLRKFWADAPRVKNSGLLDRLSSQEKKFQECLFEIITSEASYLKSLKVLEMQFMESPLLKPPQSTILSKQDYTHFFSNAKAIILVSNRMLQELELIWKNSVLLNVAQICRTMKRVAENDYGVYIRYLSNAAYQEKKFAELNTKPEFRAAVAELEDAPEVSGLKLQSFLVLPMQRITRIPLLIDAVLRAVGVDDDDDVTNEITACLAVFQKIVTDCNEGARHLENLAQLNELHNQLMFVKYLKTIPIVSKGRCLVKKGRLVHIKKPKQKLPITSTKGFVQIIQQKVLGDRRTKHFFLFNDLLLITKKKNDRFEVTEFSSKRDIHAEPIDDRNWDKYLPGGLPQDCRFLFCLVILSERSTEFILSCDSENERARWIEACRPSTTNDEDEQIYELNDCPQVQTIQRFPAAEPDELALEVSDVVNVLRKTQDGWYEGERMRDGRRGWFRADCTVEIESAHKRAKNRLQRWRLLKQTQAFQEQQFT